MHFGMEVRGEEGEEPYRIGRGRFETLPLQSLDDDVSWVDRRQKGKAILVALAVG